LKPSFLPAAFFLIVCTILLLLPGSAFPRENWLDRIQFDKLVHIGIFSLLVVLWSWGSLSAYPRGNRKFIYGIGGAMLAYGIGIEFIQHYFIANRGFEFGDILADAAGVVLGVFFSSRRYIKK
jgi:VanZ family protein